MASLASFKVEGTEYHISDENMDMELLKSLLKKVISRNDSPALEQLCQRHSDNDDWFEALLAQYTYALKGNQEELLGDNDDDELLNAL